MTLKKEMEAEARHAEVTEAKLDLFLQHFLPELTTTSSSRTARAIYRQESLLQFLHGGFPSVVWPSDFDNFLETCYASCIFLFVEDFLEYTRKDIFLHFEHFCRTITHLQFHF
jgi:hypothetical protein